MPCQPGGTVSVKQEFFVLFHGNRTPRLVSFGIDRRFPLGNSSPPGDSSAHVFPGFLDVGQDSAPVVEKCLWPGIAPT